MKTVRHLKHGFTLIELLVVIAVIGVLVALLIPSLLYSKFKSRVVTCASNYKQLTLASSVYATDDPKGRFPSFELPTDSSQLVSFRSLMPWLIGSKSTSGDGFASASGGHSFGGKTRNCNSGYGDGHVETTSAAKIKWQLQLSGSAEMHYVFY